MHCTCVRQSDLPNTTRLFADVLYHPDKTAPFFQHPFRGLESFQAAARQIEFSGGAPRGADRRVTSAKSREPGAGTPGAAGTVAVVTGQQVGLFSGPCYTIYKALHAVKLAAWLSDNGLPAVPVFWLATEDHDFAEVNHAWVFGADHQPHKMEMRRTSVEQPVGDVALAAPPVRELRAALHGLPFGEEVADLVEETYRAGNTMGKAFNELLRRILAQFDILYVDPMLPAFRALAAPALRSAVAAAPELTAGVLARNRELAEAGYHAQVHVEEQTSFVFLLENGKRLALRRNGRRVRPQQPPLHQPGADGPRGVALAERHPAAGDSGFDAAHGRATSAVRPRSPTWRNRRRSIASLLGRMPVAMPRAGFTILDSRSAKLMERNQLSLGDFFHGETSLKERMASRLVPPALAGRMRESAATVESAVARMRAELTAFDPTLAQALDRSAKKINYQLAKMERKTGPRSHAPR